MQKINQISVLLVLLILISFSAKSQTKFSISGTIKDQSSGETLIGATVSFSQLPGVGVITNAYGFYSISLPAGSYNMIISYIGYKNDTAKVELTKNQIINPNLAGISNQLEEVVVRSTAGNDITETPSGVQKLSMEDIKNVPVLFGEKDVLKTIQLLPGIKSSGDGKTGFYVRGGGADQNLILLDEATVYNASHLLGFFSVFNSDAIKDITVYKGNMPASYGGRLSSVVDIKMKDGNNQKMQVSGGLGLISSRLNIEGPIVKNKGSFIVNGRRSYVDLFTKLASDTTIKGSILYFYDINAKANYIFNEKNRIYISGYTGKDKLGLQNRFGVDWGNQTATLRWNHVYNSRLFSNTSLIYSNFNYTINYTSGGNQVIVKSNITDYHFKQDFNFYLNHKNKFDMGVDVIYHIIAPGSATVSKTSNFNPISLQNKFAFESAAYLSNEMTLTDKLKITYGARFSVFDIYGAGVFYSYDKDGNINNKQVYDKGKSVKSYFNFEPRIDINYQLNDNSSVKLSYSRNVQNIHLLTNSTSSQPSSLYIPSSNNTAPEIADQVSTGYYRKFMDGVIEFSTEVYYKGLQNQIDYKNGAILLGNENVESQLLYGSGRAYGWETFIKKKSGRFTGWLSYTLSRTERKIDGVNGWNYYPAIQDQTHNISIVGIYELSKKWTLSSTWVYNTGNAISYPSGKFSADGVPVYLYTERNGYRMPSYNRLDISAILQTRKSAKFECSWAFSIYNAYNRANPYSIVFQQDPKDPSKTQAVKTTLIQIVPSITYNFKF